MAAFAIPDPLEAENPWLATIYAQPYHESDDTAWTKPLRFGLSVLMASKGFRLNNRSAQEAFYHCREVLFQKSSKNGLFPGLLEQNQDPVSIPEWFAQKPYWRASFELPYILFHCRTPAEVTPQAPNNQQANMNSAQQVEPSAATIPTSSPVAPGVDQRPVHYPGRNSLKKLTPVSHLVDQSSILELQEEWLYNYPEFLDFTPPPMPGPRTPRRGGRQARSVVLDVPSAKHATRSAARSSSVYDQAWDSQAAGGIRAACGGARTAAAAKKRLVWLCGVVDDETRNLCVRASCPSEVTNMRAFFERHAAADKFFSDDVAVALNKWETEFHLSFYRLRAERAGDTQAGGPSSSSAGFAQRIGRESVGFRFDGDFFDRYWTCHFAQGGSPGEDEGDDEADGMEAAVRRLQRILEDAGGPAAFSSGAARSPWRQRKVLELMLFEQMLAATIEAAGGILRETKRRVFRRVQAAQQQQQQAGDSNPLADVLALCRINSVAYFSVNEEWQEFEQVLQVVDEDLGESVERVEQRVGREREWRQEKPRWTRNDERKYRSTINKLLVANERRIGELRRCQANVQSLRMSIQTRLQYMRDDLNAYFTYVTVVFLSLGFATGIFSMSEAPGRTTLNSMVSTAAVALFITICALIQARRLATVIINLWRRVFRQPILWVWGLFQPLWQSFMDLWTHLLRRGKSPPANEGHKDASSLEESAMEKYNSDTSRGSHPLRSFFRGKLKQIRRRPARSTTPEP